MYGIRVALPLAAVWGTSRSTQIAGAGYTAAAWQERTVTLLITSGSAPPHRGDDAVAVRLVQ
jgi:hypothetical protein